MITPKIQALFSFIDFLHLNIQLCLSKGDLCEDLQRLHKEKNELYPIDNYKKRIAFDNLNSEFQFKLSSLEELIIKPTLSKVFELKICDHDYMATLWNWNSEEVFKLQNSFEENDIAIIVASKEKYIEYRSTPYNDCFNTMFFSYLDETLKPLFDFFKDAKHNEFERFETKTINANSFEDAIEWALKNKNAKIYINNFFQSDKNKPLSNRQTETQSINDGIVLQSKSDLKNFNSSIKLKTMSEVFISYSWDSDKHKNDVLAFADHLRQRGYDTEIDRTLSQQQTATDFTKMMHQAMQNHNKVIVVLSKGYKAKANGFIGGAGKEYQLLLNDIDENPKKYILVSLEKRSDDLIPFALKGRDIVDMTTPDNMTTLDYKLQDVEQVSLSPVASTKPLLSPQKPNIFITVPENDCPIEIVKLNSEQSTASMSGGVYKFIDFKISFDYKNKSVQTVNSFDFEIRFNRLLDANAFKTRQDGNDTLIQDSITNPIYKGQTKTTTSVPIKIASHNISQIINTEIRIKIYTADGETEKFFNVSDIKVNPNHIGSNPDKTDLREAFDIR